MAAVERQQRDQVEEPDEDVDRGQQEHEQLGEAGLGRVRRASRTTPTMLTSRRVALAWSPTPCRRSRRRRPWPLRASDLVDVVVDARCGAKNDAESPTDCAMVRCR